MSKLVPFWIIILILGHIIYYSSEGFISSPWIKKPKNLYLESKFKALQTYSFDQNFINVLYMSVTGEKKKLDPNIKDNLIKFNLLHLLTPSALHIGIFLMFFFWFPRKIKLILMFALVILLKVFDSYWPMEKALFFRIIYAFIPMPTVSYITTFATDLLFIKSHNHLMSWYYSLAFFGVFILTSKKRYLPFNLFITNLIMNSFSGGTTHLVSLFFNLPLSSFFALAFPLYLLCVAFPCVFLLKLCFWHWNVFFKIINILNTIIGDLPSFAPSLFFILIILFFLRYKKTWVFYFLLILCLDLNRELNFKKEKTTQYIYYSVPKTKKALR